MVCRVLLAGGAKCEGVWGLGYLARKSCFRGGRVLKMTIFAVLFCTNRFICAGFEGSEWRKNADF